ncbi:MAG: translation initiation factor [Acidimicrobiaceae bacterium]|jgi:translation initiation factor IF-3
MDYGKWKYEESQRQRDSRRKSTNISIKEMKYRPKIGTGDFDTKTRKVEKFLDEGHKVKVTIMFRGRETQHPELGRRILDRVAEGVAGVARVEVMPKLDGRNMTMVLAPDKKAKAARDAQRKAESEPAAPEVATSDVATSEVATPEAPTPEAPTATPPAAPIEAATDTTKPEDAA